MPEFEINWHHIEWAEATQTYKKLCMLASRGHGKSWFFSNANVAWRLYRYNQHSSRPDLNKKLGREGYIFSFSNPQAIGLLRTLKDTITDNPILREALYGGANDSWAATHITCKNGSRVFVKSAGASTRGAHPGWIIVDDFLKDNVLYSEDQRKKYTNYFHSVIMGMIEPGGQVIVVGTPFHSQDLYGDLRGTGSSSGRSGWHVREYPAIFPDGRILWEKRFSFEYLMEIKNDVGTVNFSREYLCCPITNDSSIFPYSILERSLLQMQHYKMVNNIESFPKKLDRVVIGVDLAISANVAADYTVFVTAGLDSEGNIWVLNVTRMHGRSYGEQLAKLKSLYINFKPAVIMVESNGFQAMFAQAADSEGMPIIAEATTAKSKNDLKTGLPGIAIMFERGKIKIPIGDQYSKDMKDLLFSEFLSITWTNNGLQATGGHDDCVMAMHQAIKALDYRNTGFDYAFL